MPNTPPHANIRLQEVNTRNEYARRIIAGFRSAMPTVTEVWRYLEDALSDSLTLATEITRLADELEQTRLDHANALAAMRATVAAFAEGEADPLWYLRDELEAHDSPPNAAQTLTDGSWRHG
jgi:hypothetical protein